MKSYELTYIISSQTASDQIDSVIKEVESFIKSKEGVVLKSEKTTAQVLVYPIKKQSSGYFIISEFQMLEDKIKEMKEILQKEKNILRHFLIVKKPLKVMKERRTRKPLSLSMTEGTLKEKSGTNEILSDQDKKKGEKVELEEIEKKLDEILSE